MFAYKHHKKLRLCGQIHIPRQTQIPKNNRETPIHKYGFHTCVILINVLHLHQIRCTGSYNTPASTILHYICPL